MSRFSHHKYTWSKPFSNVRHNWELVGPGGAVHFHVSESAEYGDSCGLEFHHTRDAWRRLYGRSRECAPHHRECPVLGEPCWHDGTSLYASETLWPIIKPMFRGHDRDHEAIFRLLENEYNNHFGKPESDGEEEAA
jgi:hypothetical protein